MNEHAIRKQSERAYSQWGKQWKEQAAFHGQFEMHNMEELKNSGYEKACLLVANGHSLEVEMETIKECWQNPYLDIMVCDKALGHLIDNGVTPTYVLVCDANVSYEKYLEPYKDKLQDVILLINVCANPKWSQQANWKKVYYFVNRDVIKSEIEFGALSKCPNFIPAGTNVSNAMISMMSQSDNEGPKNYFGYDKLLLIGYDYCWTIDGNYYAYDKSGSSTETGKYCYMKHLCVRTLGGEMAYTSSNLHFSMEWIRKYLQAYGLPVVQCTDKTILPTRWRGKLREQMNYIPKTKNKAKVMSLVDKRAELVKQLSSVDVTIRKYEREHRLGYIASLV